MGAENCAHDASSEKSGKTDGSSILLVKEYLQLRLRALGCELTHHNANDQRHDRADDGGPDTAGPCAEGMELDISQHIPDDRHDSAADDTTQAACLRGAGPPQAEQQGERKGSSLYAEAGGQDPDDGIRGDP